MSALLTASDQITTMTNLWRELTNERNTTVVTDDVVGQYLDLGLQEFNRRVRFHFTTDTITLVAGTQEYSLFDDFNVVDWIEHNGVELQKRDSDEWRRKGEPWRMENQGTPQEYAIYGLKLIVRPTPSAAAVAASSTLTVRYVSTPPLFTTYGAEQLSSQESNLAVYYGVYAWSLTPVSGVSITKGQGFQREFETGVERVKADYAARMMSR